MRVTLGVIVGAILLLSGPANSYAVGTGGLASANNAPKLHMNDSGAFVISWIDLMKRRPVRVLTGNVNGRTNKIVGLGGERSDANESEISSGIAANGAITVSWRRAPYSGSDPRASADVLRWASFAARRVRPTAITSHPLSHAFFRGSGDHLAVAGNGAAMSAWMTTNGPESASVQTMFRDASGTFLPPFAAFTQTGLSGVNDVRGYMDERGIPTLVWSRGEWGIDCDQDGNNCQQHEFGDVQVMTGNGLGGFLPAERFSDNGNCEFGDFDVAASGAAVLILKCWVAGSGFLAYTTRAPDQPFGELRRLTVPTTEHTSYSKADFPSARVLPDGRVLVAWLQYSKWIENRRQNKSTHIGRIKAAVGAISAELGPSRFLTGNLRAVSLSAEIVKIEPVPEITIGRAGQPYLTGRFRSDDHCRIAAIRPDLTLGNSVAYSPAKLNCGKVEIAASGRALTLVPYSKGFGFRVVRLRAPRAGK